MVEDDLVVGCRAVPPVQDLLPGEVLEDQLLVLVDVSTHRVRGRDVGGRARHGPHDRGHRRGRDIEVRLRSCGFGTGLGGRGLLLTDLRPPVLTHPRLDGHRLVQLPVGGGPA
ncbi:hypothetical protein ACFVRB_27840 [Streptomyces nojiriensis]|uniref:hypothetical protein n=1 Tax=Streptomyces nojiriensis TaxID=66374 RepID=UPI0036DCA880